MKKKVFILFALSLLGFSLNSCSSTFLTNLLAADNGGSNTRQSNSSQVDGRGKTKKAKSKDVRENRSISKTSGNVVLTCLGEGPSLSEATSNALRSGIEQTYGAFVSSNTKILNDKLVKDEVVSVSSGNIVAYEIKSQNFINNKWNVVVQAEISQSKLANFAQSKGASVDINTSALAMNIKMARFYKESERKAFLHLGEQLKELAPSCIDYNLYITKPIKGIDNRREVWFVNTWLGYKMNANYQVANNMIKETIKSLSMSEEEVKKNESIGENVSRQYIDDEGFYLRAVLPEIVYDFININRQSTYHYNSKYFDKIARDNFVLYRNGIDITTEIPRIDAYGKSKKSIHCSDGFTTNVYKAEEYQTGRTGELGIKYERAGNYSISNPELTFLKKEGENWFGVYEVVLTLKDLERFDANYQIHSKVQK